MALITGKSQRRPSRPAGKLNGRPVAVSQATRFDYTYVLYEKIKRCEITMNFKCDFSRSRHRLKLEVVVSEACHEDSVSNIKGRDIFILPPGLVNVT